MGLECMPCSSGVSLSVALDWRSRSYYTDSLSQEVIDYGITVK